MLKTNKLLCYLALGILPFYSVAQEKDKAPANWFNLDHQKDGAMGISTDKAYELLKGRKASPVIVAVLDGGVDIHHEDLKDVLWKNKKEIPGNGKDDDGNGYIDDVYGWNFLGNAKGENVDHDNLEVTRLIRIYEPKYISVLPSTPLSEKERREFVAYQKMVTDYTSKMDEAAFGKQNYVRIKESLEAIVKGIGKDPKAITAADLDAFPNPNNNQKNIIRIAKKEMEKGSFEKFFEDIKEGATYFSDQVDYHLNKGFDPRPLIGDTYDDASERHYGNADVKGPDADHGTHVAGIIGAKRKNNLGIDGVSDQVQIMSVRVVPNGDERDKDVANAIRYAVDNGAKVINMSFGKGYVYNKKTVDEAVKYAESKDVLLVHAAGNDSKNVDVEKNYPMKYFTDSVDAIIGEAKNWITVGATAWKVDADLLAEFSNYGYRSVDVFAPGVKIYSTMPESKYKDMDGTSMAAPVVSGLAALIRAYYPSFTAEEVKQVIMNSVTKIDQKVKVKGESGNKRVYLDEISVSGGVVNAYKAIVEADKLLSKKK
ncbi:MULTISPECIES: S8 family peptidase [Sphingobacterium]|uniref:S8 family peptidase n=1 Tax=Sphingobacterium tenebrionis TaxID=3111775 RepID=A0ABU8I1J4_9SPHI|nr:S8 family peptidase [Sphingobacterium sp. CZ-2]QBR11083.1 peptidase S8 [Sphingobacterium sp. CZ-2]